MQVCVCECVCVCACVFPCFLVPSVKKVLIKLELVNGLSCLVFITSAGCFYTAHFPVKSLSLYSCFTVFPSLHFYISSPIKEHFKSIAMPVTQQCEKRSSAQYRHGEEVRRADCPLLELALTC